VYIETTVLSYVTSKPGRDLLVAAHQQVTVEWWEKTLLLFEPFISPLVIEEASQGDKDAAQLRLGRIAGFPTKGKRRCISSRGCLIPWNGLFGFMEFWPYHQSPRHNDRLATQ
jgi:hypothetical protein